jgi:hypothetical protein
MKYNEALEYAKNLEWKLGNCGHDNCWCASILPKEDVIDDEGNAIDIVPSGLVDKSVAEHIVKIHNESIKSKK